MQQVLVFLAVLRQPCADDQCVVADDQADVTALGTLVQNLETFLDVDDLEAREEYKTNIKRTLMIMYT